MNIKKRFLKIIKRLNIVIIVIVGSLITSTHDVCSQENFEISLKGLYSTGIINPKYLMEDNSFYLKTINETKLLLKYGLQNKPFLLDLNKHIINSTPKINWDNLSSELLVSPYFNHGCFVFNGNELKNTMSQEIIEFKGKDIISYNLNESKNELFVYSFTGKITEPKGIGFWNTSTNQKIGYNYFEIWDLEKKSKIYYFKKYSFRKGFNPQLLFWLNVHNTLIFLNNYKMTLFVINY